MTHPDDERFSALIERARALGMTDTGALVGRHCWEMFRSALRSWSG